MSVLTPDGCMHTGLKEFRTERIRHLDYLVGKYTNEPTMPPERLAKLERKLADYQSKVWPNGRDQEQVHPTAKDAMLSMTCATVGTTDYGLCTVQVLSPEMPRVSATGAVLG
jgi:hypothetical protein